MHNYYVHVCVHVQTSVCIILCAHACVELTSRLIIKFLSIKPDSEIEKQWIRSASYNISNQTNYTKNVLLIMTGA